MTTMTYLQDMFPERPFRCLFFQQSHLHGVPSCAVDGRHSFPDLQPGLRLLRHCRISQYKWHVLYEVSLIRQACVSWSCAVFCNTSDVALGKWYISQCFLLHIHGSEITGDIKFGTSLFSSVLVMPDRCLRTQRKEV